MNDQAKRVVAISEHGTMPIPQMSDTAAMIHMIERMARDPSIDLARLQMFIELRLKLEDREAARQFDEAMADAQAEMRPVAADAANKQTNSKYASYAALDRALRPIYSKHRFGVSFNTGKDAPEGYVRVLAAVTRGGHTRDYHIDMPADGKGAKGGDVMTKTHATGSAATYGRRYLLTMIFNIAVGDDDGNAAGGETITAAQADALKCLVAEVAVDLPKFLKYFKIESIEDLPAKNYQRAVDAVEAKRKKQ